MHRRLHPTDAQTYWMSSKIPNDQFLMYCFDGDAPFTAIADSLIYRARHVPDLAVRFADSPLTLRYPKLVPMPVTDRHVVEHPAGEIYDRCLQLIAGLFTNQLDSHESPWRVHVFPSVLHAPHGDGPASIVVLQISHALGDGRVVSSLARRMFGDDTEVDGSMAGRGRLRELFRRASAARELSAQLERDTSRGVVPPEAPGRPRTPLNVAPNGDTSIRTVVRDKEDFSGASVTVVALTVVSVALSRYLTSRGEPVPDGLGAEVTLGKTGERRARNHFRNAGVSLHPDVADIGERAHRISTSLTERRARGEHPAFLAQSLATEMVPAFLLHWGVKQFDASVVPDRVTGNTVVSSVYRGEADLSLCCGPVRFTSGFPALSPVMGLTHGVHGIGDTVTIGITSSESAMPDPDVYADMVDAAVDEVARELSGS